MSGYFKDKILPILIGAILPIGISFMIKLYTDSKEDNRKTQDDRQDELIQDRINHDQNQDSLITILIKKNLK